MIDKKVVKYYRMLRIPARFSKISRYMYLGIYVIIITLYSFKYFSYLENGYTVLYLIILHSIFIALLPLCVKLLIRYMKPRQCVNMSLFLLMPGLFMEIMGAFTDIVGLIYIVVPIIGVLAIRVFTRSRTKSMMIILYSLTAETMFALIIDNRTPSTILRFILMSIPIITSIWFVEFLSCRGEFDIYRIASSWIKTLLLNDEKEFSAIMDSIGFENNVRTHVMFFDFNPKGVAIMVPEIHYGPFRNVGSASLPHIIDSVFERYGVDVFTLHSAGSHERNLVSINESLKYGYDVVNRLITRKELSEEVLHEPFRVYTKFFEAFVIQTSTTSYIIISTPVRGNDDIPYEVQKRAVELSRVYGFKDVAVIDAHNTEGPPINEPQQYEEVLLATLSRSSRQCTDLQVGYGEAFVKGLVKGLCSNKVKVLTIKCDDALYGLIYLYGNNAGRGVRDELRKIALNHGYNDVELITSDDHSCSGMNFDAPYYVIELSSSLVKAVEVALTESLNNISKCKVYTAVFHTKTKIVGPNIFKLLEIAKVVSRKVLRYMLFSYLVMYILTLITLPIAYFYTI